MDEEINRNWLMSFFANPLVGIVGSISSLIGLALAILFFVASQKAPDLVYSINPSKNVLIRADIPSNLSVIYKGKPIEGKDIVAVTVSLWNKGKHSIKQDSILKQIAIETYPKVNILEANITKKSRDVTGLEVVYDEDIFANGIMPLNWKILENNDGGNIQIIYSGSRDAEIKITGTIEGQGQPRLLSALNINKEIKSPLDQAKFLKWVLPGTLIFSLVLVGLMIAFRHKYSFFPFNLSFLKEGKPIWFAFTVACTIYMGIAIFLFLKVDEWYPPFGL